MNKIKYFKKINPTKQMIIDLIYLNPLRSVEIAKTLYLSDKTIRNELKKIPDFLNEKYFLISFNKIIKLGKYPRKAKYYTIQKRWDYEKLWSK